MNNTITYHCYKFFKYTDDELLEKQAQHQVDMSFYNTLSGLATHRNRDLLDKINLDDYRLITSMFYYCQYKEAGYDFSVSDTQINRFIGNNQYFVTYLVHKDTVNTEYENLEVNEIDNTKYENLEVNELDDYIKMSFDTILSVGEAQYLSDSYKWDDLSNPDNWKKPEDYPVYFIIDGKIE